MRGRGDVRELESLRGASSKLEKLDADDPGFDDELSTLMAEIRRHIEDEEGKMFAHMRQVILATGRGTGDGGGRWTSGGDGSAGALTTGGLSSSAPAS